MGPPNGASCRIEKTSLLSGQGPAFPVAFNRPFQEEQEDLTLPKYYLTSKKVLEDIIEPFFKLAKSLTH